jgi:acylphosphatase
VQRRTYYFSGHVQGVGFRYTARHVASGFPVTGFVRNLADGRVEMVAEGEPKDLDALAADLRRKMEGFIKRVDVDESPATGQFTGFSVRH